MSNGWTLSEIGIGKAAIHNDRHGVGSFLARFASEQRDVHHSEVARGHEAAVDDDLTIGILLAFNDSEFGLLLTGNTWQSRDSCRSLNAGNSTESIQHSVCTLRQGLHICCFAVTHTDVQRQHVAWVESGRDAG